MSQPTAPTSPPTGQTGIPHFGTPTDSSRSGTPTFSQQVHVWDRYIRIFHWTLVAAFTTAYLTEDGPRSWHVWAGYLVGALVVSRLVWGVVGPHQARFRTFVRPPLEAWRYLRGLFVGGAPRHLGHNPAGGLMVIALLACLALTTVSGIIVYGTEGHGPLATVWRSPSAAAGEKKRLHRAAEATEERWEEIHEVAANGCLVLIGLHVAGVLLSSLRHRENLTRAMVTGRKRAAGTSEQG